MQNFHARNSGLIMQWAGAQLTIWNNRSRSFFELSPTASAIWLLCNGTLSTTEIVEYLQSIDPGQADAIKRDVQETLDYFRTNDLIVSTAENRTPRELKKVGFCNFWSNFNIRENYFTTMLSYCVDVLLVEPRNNDVDLVFFSEFPSSGFDHSDVDSKRTRKIQVCIDHPPDFTRCDYAFSDRTVEAKHARRHFQMPLWAMYLDWIGFDLSADAFGEKKDFALYNPRTAASYLGSVLFFKESKKIDRVRTMEHASLRQGPPRKLTIGMATHDDFDGAYFTIQAIRLFHPEVTKDTEILVLDNNPEGPCGKALRRLTSWVNGLRYVPFDQWRGTAVRDIIFREARTPYVLCLDSHVMLVPGSIKKLIDYFETSPDCKDLLQGPLLDDSLRVHGTHFHQKWSHGMFGQWGLDERGKSEHAPPFEIQMQGLGLFACRKDAWLGFNPRFRGFGGEEGYIHEKFRQAGHHTLCLPFLRWLHRFGRPDGVGYGMDWSDRIHNYHVGFRELGLDTVSIDDHFNEHLGQEHYARIKKMIVNEQMNPFAYFDALYCINLDSARNRWRIMQERFQKLGIDKRIRRFSAVETPRSHHIGCALSHRMIIEQAQKQDLARIMVFEDDAVFLDDTPRFLANTVEELKQLDWRLFYLGGKSWLDTPYEKPDGFHHLWHVHASLTCTHAIAYHCSVYEKILDEVPETEQGIEQWLKEHHGIDQYYMRLDKRYLSCPVVASQPFLIEQEDPEYRDRFTL